ncbi:MAG: DTW domain-containing protein [Spirochaetia bacterium]|nr:DTW domain-containing protein [Spirochaetia bacterium]
MSYRCPRCMKKGEFCLCKYTEEIDSGIKFVLLMHPKEVKKNRTGTGWITRISLKGCEIIEGLDFAENTRLNKLLEDPQYYPVLLYPGEDAWTASHEKFKEEIGNRTLLAIIIDSTWFCSRKIIQHNPQLLKLPKLSFSGSYRSIFTFKREPRPEYISTIETCYYLIKELQTAGIANQNVNPEPLMNVFKEMIKNQLRAENERIMGLRPDIHHMDGKYCKLKEIPDFD